MLLGEWGRRVWYLLNRRRLERELEEEMAAHRELMADSRAFGNALRLREEARDAWGWSWLDSARQDVRHGLRIMRRAPGFTAGAVLILATGIGLNLAFFHLLDVSALRPPPVKDPATLVRFLRRAPGFASTGFPYPAIEFIRRNNTVLAAVLIRTQARLQWEDNPEDRLRAAFVSANWFSELGYGAALGRVLADVPDADDTAPPVAVVSHGFWLARLEGAPDVVGRTIRLNGRAATIVGVGPPVFPGLRMEDMQIWLPIQHVDRFVPGMCVKESWTSHDTEMYARLRPGVSPAAAAEALRSAIQELARMRPAEFDPNERLEPSTGQQRFRFERDRLELLSSAAVVGSLTLIVLLVASANLGSLVLSKGIGRLREFSLRAALGASRSRIFRHLLAEAAVLTLLGVVTGIVLGYWGTRLLATYTDVPPWVNLTPDWRLFGAGCAVAFLAMLAFGVTPAWLLSRRDVFGTLKDGGQLGSHGLLRARFRHVLVGVQVAGCCVLLVVAAGMSRGLQRLLSADVGFRYESVAVLHVPIEDAMLGADAAREYWDRVADRCGPEKSASGGHSAPPTTPSSAWFSGS